MESLKNKHWDLTNKIIQCAENVHKAIGQGFTESVYRKAMSIEMTNCGIKHEEDTTFKLFHREVQVGSRPAESIVEDVIILKYLAKLNLTENNFLRGVNYLKASKFEIGLLFNFGGKKLQCRRLFNNRVLGTK